MNRSLQSAALALICVFILGWLLIAGRNLLIPFVIATIVWYVIDMLANSIANNPIGLSVPRWVTVPLAIILIAYATTIVFDLARDNIIELTRDAPIYQARLTELAEQALAFFKIDDPGAFEKLLPEINVPRLVARLASTTTSYASTLSLVLIYAIFLLLEQAKIDSKFRRLFGDEKSADTAIAVRTKITDGIRSYMGIKTGMSLLTAVLSYFILVAIGVKYAPLFALIIFLLNYIPTIGSMIAVVFPSLLALLQFDTMWPFVGVVALLGSVQFMIGNILEPRVAGNSLNLSPLVILLSLSLWGSIWGVTGMVLCVPLTVIMMIICGQFPFTRPFAILLSADGDIGEAVTIDDDN